MLTLIRRASSPIQRENPLDELAPVDHEMHVRAPRPTAADLQFRHAAENPPPHPPGCGCPSPDRNDQDVLRPVTVPPASTGTPAAARAVHPVDQRTAAASATRALRPCPGHPTTPRPNGRKRTGDPVLTVFGIGRQCSVPGLKNQVEPSQARAGSGRARRSASGAEKPARIHRRVLPAC